MQPEPPEYFFSAKCVFRAEMIEDGQPVSVFEERIIFVKACEFDEAFDKAEKAGGKYAGKNQTEKNKTTFLACVGIFIVQDPVEDGVEVFSMLRESNMPSENYLKLHYQTGSERDSFLFQSERGLDPV
jgi:hypothetical protein